MVKRRPYRHNIQLFWIISLTLMIGNHHSSMAHASTVQTNDVRSAAACYGNTNNYLRLFCDDEKEIKVLKVIQGAKLSSLNCQSPATTETYKSECCVPEPSDCTIVVQDSVSRTCNGHLVCEVIAMWSLVSKECDQTIYPNVITYMQTYYVCVSTDKFTTPATTQEPSTNHTLQLTSSTVTNVNPVVVLSTRTAADKDQSSDDMTDSMVGALIAGSLGMLITFFVFIVYWRRKRRLRIIGKPQASVWDYLLNQTFTVRGERGYDHFSSCRSSASSEGDNKSPVFRKTVWLPNISPTDDAESDVYNDTDTIPKLEFHQIGSASPYAFLSLGRQSNNSNSNTSAQHDEA